MATNYDSEWKFRATFDTSEVQKSAKEMGKAVEEAINQNSGSTDELIKQITQALKEAMQRAAELDKEIDKIKGKKTPTEEYKQMAKELEAAEQALYNIRVEASRAQSDEERASLQPMIDQAQQRVDEIHASMLKLIQDGKAFTIGDSQKLKQKTIELNKVLGKMRNLLVKLKGFTFDKLKRNFNEISKSAKQTQRTVKNIIKGLIGFSTITALFSKLRNAFKEGFGYLEQFDGKTIKFKTDMENFKKSLMYVKNSIATAFAPLITAVVPYLQAAANALGDLMTKLGAFFAMMTGQSIMIQAKKDTKEYDKALKSAAGSAKKLNAELYGFDTLNKQQDKSGGGASGAKMFEEVAVADKLSQNTKDFITELKELWNNKDYYGLGAKIAEGLNTGVEKLDNAVNNAREKLEKGAKNLAIGFNGLIEGFKAGEFGKLIADSISTAFGTENAFLEEFHFDSLGAKVGDSLSHILTDTEWNEIGRNLALKINGVFSFVENLVSAENLIPDTLSAIKDTFYGFVDNFEPEHIANSITTLFNEVATILAETNWTDVLNTALSWIFNIVDWVVDTVSNLDWSKVGETVGNLLMSLRLWLFSPERITKTVGHITSWILQLTSAVVRFILGMIKGAFEPIIEKFTDLGFDTIAGFFQGIKDTFEVFIGAAKKWFQGLVDAVKELFGISSPSKVFSDIGGWIIEGLKQGILNMWNKVKDGIYDTFDGFKSTVKKIFKIDSPSKVFEQFGEFIDLGFARGIEGEKSAVEFAMNDMMQGVIENASLTPALRMPSFSNVAIPALATGGVVPPNAYGGSGTSGNNSLISKIQELIDRLDGGASPVEIHAHLELDGREIYDTVVTENNNQLQRTGTSRIKV